MSTITPVQPTLPLPPPEQVYRITVDRYDQMVQCGAIDHDEPVELLSGVLTYKMPKNPKHSTSATRCRRALEGHIPAGWHVRQEQPLRIPNYDEPEPDGALARGDDKAFANRHPGPADVVLVVEVAESSLARDRGEKGDIYGRAAIPYYWIVNLVDGLLEVYTDPNPAGGYRSRRDFRPGDRVPVVLGGTEIGQLDVADLLP
jgi:Uma2 family endonuclease